ncbi:MAG: MCP four helix bundle domain-containing protein [Bacteroidetes bacterium]|nr:MCP four helix bundle domain-containing protein [Bacteroidota bacterium]MBL6943948.1 MCP four helix bundle domain-containing protein [Bacteroidales bacterium]
MNPIKKITLRTKLIITIFLILGFTFFVGWRGIVGIHDINEDLNSIYTEQYLPTRIIANTNIALITWNRAVLNHVLSLSRANMEKYEQIMLTEGYFIKEQIKVLSNMKNLSEEGMKMISKFKDGFQKTDLVRERVIALSSAGRKDEAIELIRTELRPIVDDKDKNMTEFMMLQEKQLDEVIADSDTRYQTGLRRILIIIGIVLVLSFITIFYFSYIILNNIKKLKQGMKLAAEGKYNLAKVNIQTEDEFGYLAEGFNKMTNKIEQNIIEIKSAQEELQSTEKFALLGRLSGSIAHEIKNPLAVIDSSVYILKMKLKNADDSTLEHINRIKNQVDISNQIIISLQDLSKTQKSVKQPFDIADSIEKSITLAGLSDDEIRIIKKVERGSCTINADVNQLAIAFKNIIINAMQAMGDKGTLLITATGIDNNMCEISFKDSGSGIPIDKLDQIFEPFYSTKTKNLGIGLTIIKNIIEENGGTIEVTSEIGEGSVFIVRFPASKTKGGLL